VTIHERSTTEFINLRHCHARGSPGELPRAFLSLRNRFHADRVYTRVFREERKTPRFGEAHRLVHCPRFDGEAREDEATCCEEFRNGPKKETIGMPLKVGSFFDTHLSIHIAHVSVIFIRPIRLIPRPADTMLLRALYELVTGSFHVIVRYDGIK